MTNKICCRSHATSHSPSSIQSTVQSTVLSGKALNSQAYYLRAVRRESRVICDTMQSAELLQCGSGNKRLECSGCCPRGLRPEAYSNELIKCDLELHSLSLHSTHNTPWN